MKPQNVYSQMTHVIDTVRQLETTISDLQQQMRLLLEENSRLLRENNLLRTKSTPQRMSLIAMSPTQSGRDNLLKLYKEGFHICNVNYGRLRTDGDCLFCMAFANKATKTEES
jgi:regulator of replication initiation timing